MFILSVPDLYLDSDQIVTIDTEMWEGLENLENLSISSNNIIHLINEAFVHLRKCNLLDLLNNHLESFNG